ncbi:MAG TPA: nucleotide exchange factor GrpE [Symbiobacteriaceae bacterium]|nr:nucleotide exchange factor GrpE [Symbiobacteriaceae bacterium]
MKDSQVHTLAREIGDAIRRLEAFRSDVEKLQSDVADMQASVTGLDAQVRLVTEVRRLAALSGEPAPGPAEAPAEAPPAEPAPDPVMVWFGQWWGELVAAVTERMAAGAPPGQAGAAPLARTLEQFRTIRLEPLRQWAGQAHRHVNRFGADPDLKPAADRYLALRRQADRLYAEVTAWEEELTGRCPWTADLKLPPVSAKDCLTAAPGGARAVPRVDLSGVLTALNQELNRCIAAHAAGAPDSAPAADAGRERMAKLEAELGDLIGGFMDLKHSLAEAVGRREAGGGAAADAARSVVQSLLARLRELEVEEIEIQPGDRVNQRLHVVVAREPDSRYSDGKILRVIVPGYRYRGEVVRLAQVVATP